MENVYHFYHIYADGGWQSAVEQHLEALGGSGLIRENGFSFNVGFVGTEENVAAARAFLDRRAGPWREVAANRQGWEQVTLSALAEKSKTSDGFVFYAHTKGAASPSKFNTAWRQRMTLHTVAHWRDAVKSLETCHAYGCHWMNLEGFWLFGGNFWWTRMEYVRLLPPLQLHSRWAAEGWVGLLPKYIEGFSACDPAGPFPGKI